MAKTLPRQSSLDWNEPVHLPAAPVHIQTQSVWFCFTVASVKWKLLNYFQYIYFFFQFFYPPIITSSENKAQLSWNWNAENKGVEMTSLTLAKLLVTPLNSRCAVNLSPLSLSLLLFLTKALILLFLYCRFYLSHCFHSLITSAPPNWLICK